MQGNELLLQGGDGRPVEGGSKEGAVRCWLVTTEAVDDVEQPALSVLHLGRRAAELPERFPMLPQRLQCLHRRFGVGLLEVVAQPFTLGAALHVVHVVVDIDVNLASEKLGECLVGEVEDVPATHLEYLVERGHVYWSDLRHESTPAPTYDDGGTAIKVTVR